MAGISESDYARQKAVYDEHLKLAQQDLKSSVNASAAYKKPTMNTYYQPSVQERLEKVAASHAERKQDAEIALAILGRHPEFVEFLELQQILNRIDY